MEADLTLEVQGDHGMAKAPSVVQLVPPKGTPSTVKKSTSRIGQFPSTFMSPAKKNQQILKSQNVTPLPAKLLNELDMYR